MKRKYGNIQNCLYFKLNLYCLLLEVPFFKHSNMLNGFKWKIFFSDYFTVFLIGPALDNFLVAQYLFLNISKCISCLKVSFPIAGQNNHKKKNSEKS